jgi:hypothetical protein
MAVGAFVWRSPNTRAGMVRDLVNGGGFANMDISLQPALAVQIISFVENHPRVG